jgi:peptidoglycan/xylan/chitin deacetylase (PgdA/CDA1 family)
MKNKVLLSFDIEEFDLPREHGAEISVEEGCKVSAEGLRKILRLLKKCNKKATFFVTGNFAQCQPELVKKIVTEGHEVACHGVDHFKPRATDVAESKKIVEGIAGVKVVGYRQPRMFKIDYDELKKSGYGYDSSVNPALIPGRYNHMGEPRKPYKRKGIIEVPVSVAGKLRVPLFWLALHLFPVKLYKKLARKSLKETGYFATYFHPWEFADLAKYKIPKYIKRNSGDVLIKRLEAVINEVNDCDFVTFKEFVKGIYK